MSGDGKALYDKWAEFAKVPSYWNLSWRDKQRWDRLASEVAPAAVADPYTAAGTRAADGVSLQKKKVVGLPPHRREPSTDEQIRAMFDGSLFEASDNPFDKLITGVTPAPGDRDRTDDAASALTAALERMAADDGLRRALVAALNTSELRKEFTKAFFEHLVDDAALFWS